MTETEIAHGGMKEETEASWMIIRAKTGKVDFSNGTPARMKWKARVRNAILFLKGVRK